MIPYVSGLALHHPAEVDISLEELVFGASAAALADAGLGRGDIDGVCLASSDQLDGRAISSMHMAGPAGAVLRDEIKVADDGSAALAAAALRIEAGVSRRVLVVSWTKPDASDMDAALGVNAEPTYARPAGVHPWAAEAMVTTRFLREAAMTPDVGDALLSRRLSRAVTDDWFTYPLKSCHIPPQTQGAVALVLTDDPTGVVVSGLAWGVDQASPAGRSPALGSLPTLARAAYEQAGYQPTAESGVETTDRTVFRLCMSAVGLGLVPAAEAAEAVAAGVAGMNASGGLWNSNPGFAAGLECAARAAQRVREGEEAVVAHSSYGSAGQGNFVAVMRRTGS